MPTATALEACTVPDPEGGSYWVMVQNWLAGQGVDEVEGVIAVVPGTDAGNLTVSGPDKVAADTPFDLTLTWDVAGLDPGQVWFGHVELGSSNRNTSDVGSFGVILRNPS